MNILKTEYMSPEELEYFRMIESYADQVRAKYPETMTAEEVEFAARVNDMLNTYSWNLYEQDKLNERIYSPMKPDEWKSFFRNRAATLGKLYEENERILAEVKECLKRPVNKAIAKFWCDMAALHFNNRGIIDLHCVLPILDRIIPFLEEYENYNSLSIAYYFYSSFCSMTMLQFNDGSNYKYAKKLIDMRRHYKEIKNPNEIFNAYEIFYFYGIQDGTITPDEAFGLYKEMLQFWRDDPIEEPEDAKQRCLSTLKTNRDNWIGSVDAYVDMVTPENKEFFCKLAEERYKELIDENVPFRKQTLPYYAYALHAMVLKGELSRAEALSRFFEHYTESFTRYFGSVGEADDERENDAPSERQLFCGLDEDPEVMSNLIETVTVLERWTRKCPDKALCRKVIDRLIDDIPKFYHFYTNVPLVTSQQLTELCFSLLPYLDSAEKKERWVLELVTKKQFATHLHSVMVQKIAGAVAKSLYEARPELFDSTINMIGGRPLMEFITKCALFHDVGKNDIATVVNVQARALDDKEFLAIRKHPYFGYHRLMDDPDFSCYKDVVLCHHKTYDGKGGYPAEADNTHSPYKIIIDLITICDCMDAATDDLGRNYKPAKTVEQFTEELMRGAGTQYNPDIALHIKNSPELQRELKAVITDERLETAYEIASTYR